MMDFAVIATCILYHFGILSLCLNSTSRHNLLMDKQGVAAMLIFSYRLQTTALFLARFIFVAPGFPTNHKKNSFLTLFFFLLNLYDNCSQRIPSSVLLPNDLNSPCNLNITYTLISFDI